MKLRTTIARLCVYLFAVVVSTDLHAMMEADKFIGAWNLVSAEFHARGAATVPGDERRRVCIWVGKVQLTCWGEGLSTCNQMARELPGAAVGVGTVKVRVKSSVWATERGPRRAQLNAKRQ